MKRLNRYLSLLLVTVLLMSSAANAVFAQDDADGSANSIFLPLISGGSGNTEQTDDSDEEPVAQPSIQTVDGSISALSAESTDKATINAVVAAEADALRVVSLIVTFESSFDVGKLQANNAQVVHRYSALFNGASLVTQAGQVAAIANLQGITGVYLDELQQLDTDASPSFIKATSAWDDLGGQKKAGEGITVGILDSGIWPEHPSLSNPDPSGKPYAAPPVVPGSNGFVSNVPRSTCNFGNTGYNSNDVAFTCNNKLIGAYSFIDTYKAVIGGGLLDEEFDSARDDNGHGTHTATTTAGNGKVAASIFGVNRGKVSGIAPRAHIIAYRVCADQGCFSSDSLAAIEQAILDKVNVINFSISGGGNPYNDIVELGFLKAYDNGVFVAASAGNAGPGADTVAHRGPWVTTVAASTSDRAFVSTVTLKSSDGSTLNLKGVSVMGGISTHTPVILSPDPNCGVQAAGLFTGKIVVCSRGGIGRVQKGFNVLQSGASGMLLRNLITQDTETDNHFLPAVHLNGIEGDQLIAFLAGHPGVTAIFTAGVAASAKGDVIAGFSSRGGPGQTLGINKPDVTAPGVQILAGASPMHVAVAGGPNGQLFQAIAGTSMSSPHVAGAGALLKDLHPDWTPGQIKSALMTTARVKGVVKEDEVTPATAYDYGAGRIDLKYAGNPGITFDETAANYLALQNQLWNANYPSVYHPGLPGSITVQRTAKSVLSKNAKWELETSTDKNDWKIIVPEEISIPAGGQVTFPITIDARSVALGQVRHGTIWLETDKIKLHIPVSFVRGQAVVTINKSCVPVVFTKATSTNCTVTMQNTSFTPANVDVLDKLPHHLTAVEGTVVGAVRENKHLLHFTGTLAGAQPPQVIAETGLGLSPFGYDPLSAYGVTPIGGVGDETITNFNVPPFVYAGETWTRIGVVSNGYLVVGGGTGGDINYINPNPVPSPAAPNNFLAPFWTDLDPSVAVPGAGLRIGILTDGTNSWLVVDWENVPNYSNANLNSFQVWIGIGSVQDINFVYGPTISAGDPAGLTVGAENKFGNSGNAVYQTGPGGSAPTPTNTTNYEVNVASVAGAAGEIHTITYTAKASERGKYQNCAELTSNLFQGVAISCVNLQVVKTVAP